MVPVLAALHRHFAEDVVRFARDAASAARLIDGERWYPELVLVCQCWPQQFAQADVHRLLALLPLARWVCVLGAWCESDGRNGSPWPDAVRVRARAAAARIGLEQAVLDGRIPALPLTASRDEVFAFDGQCVSPGSRGDEPVRVATLTPDAELRRALRDLLAAAGFARVSLEASGPPADAIVWDADPLMPAHLAELQEVRALHPAAAVVALTTLAHPEDVKTLLALGASAVVAKSHCAQFLPAALNDGLKVEV